MKTTARRNFFANWQRLAGLSFFVALISGFADTLFARRGA
jgi:hypothetical protein